MDILLTETEARILGALIEKELATPEYYPLTLNALVNACNQKSNRDPIMCLDESDVVRGLDRLRHKGFARQSAEGGRVPKYCHSLGERFAPPELAIMAELLLRGAQTLGELRGRCERLSTFENVAAVEEALDELKKPDPPLVALLPRQPGQKEQRYAHLLSGEPLTTPVDGQPPPEAARLRVMAEEERLTRLENEVSALKGEVAELRALLEDFRAQFE